MDFRDFYAGKDDDGRRLDRIVRSLKKDLALPQIYKYLRKGLIRLNGKKARPESRVCEGDVISIAGFIADTPPANSDKSLTTGKSGGAALRIVFEDDDILVVNKPYDQSVHGGSGSLDALVKSYLSEGKKSTVCGGGSLSFTPGPLHRLDRKTSGLIVFSKSLAGAQGFSTLISEHGVKKTYYALLQGKLLKPESWQDYIYSREERGAGFHRVECAHEPPAKEDTEGTEGWKKALTEAEPLGYGFFSLADGTKTPVTLAKITIETGRKHQIRAQSALHSHPLLGDTAYGGKEITAAKKGLPRLSRDFYLMAGELFVPERNQLFSIDFHEEFFDIINYCDIKEFGV